MDAGTVRTANHSGVPGEVLASVRLGRKPLWPIPSFGSVVAKSAGDQQPDDALSHRMHWQIPDAEILYRGAIPFLRFRDPPTLLFGSF
jgi:hypothetical protein